MTERKNLQAVNNRLEKFSEGLLQHKVSTAILLKTLNGQLKAKWLILS
jgi:hypothetical protein